VSISSSSGTISDYAFKVDSGNWQTFTTKAEFDSVFGAYKGGELIPGSHTLYVKVTEGGVPIIASNNFTINAPPVIKGFDVVSLDDGYKSLDGLNQIKAYAGLSPDFVSITDDGSISNYKFQVLDSLDNVLFTSQSYSTVANFKAGIAAYDTASLVPGNYIVKAIVTDNFGSEANTLYLSDSIVSSTSASSPFAEYYTTVKAGETISLNQASSGHTVFNSLYNKDTGSLLLSQQASNQLSSTYTNNTGADIQVLIKAAQQSAGGYGGNFTLNTQDGSGNPYSLAVKGTEVTSPLTVLPSDAVKIHFVDAARSDSDNIVNSASFDVFVSASSVDSAIVSYQFRFDNGSWSQVYTDLPSFTTAANLAGNTQTMNIEHTLEVKYTNANLKVATGTDKFTIKPFEIVNDYALLNSSSPITTINVLGNDQNYSNQTQISIVDQPKSGLVTINENGSITYSNSIAGITPPSLVSSAADGTQSNNYSYNASVSNDGKYVIFVSRANNYGFTDNNGEDIFLKDTQTGEIKLVSHSQSSLTSTGNSWSGEPYMTPDAKYVFFTSSASDLVANDTNNSDDVFRYEVATGNTIRVSEAANGTQFNNNSEGNAVSADGRYVVFNSRASNIVAGDNNGQWDIFVKDIQTGDVQRVNISSNGVESNGNSSLGSISNDGRYVTFVSRANNLVSGDTNGVSDVFMHDRVTGETTRISVGNNGSQINNSADNAWISGNGKFVVYDSYASNIVANDINSNRDIFVYDVENGTTERTSLSSSETEGNSNSYLEYMVVRSISDDGRFIVFSSYADNLVSGDTNGRGDVFLRDRLTGDTFLVSKNSSGSTANNWSEEPSISANGKYIVFTSRASNLVAGDTNSNDDIFIQQINYNPPTSDSFSYKVTDSSGNSDVATVYIINPQGFDSVDSDGTFNGTDTNTLNEIASGTSSISMTVGVDNSSGATLTYVFAVDLNKDGVYQQSEIIGTVTSNSNLISLDYNPSVLLPDSYNTQVAIKDPNGNILSQLYSSFTYSSITAPSIVTNMSDGTQGNNYSGRPSVSSDGKYVVFTSGSDNYGFNDQPWTQDIFLKNMQTGEIKLINHSITSSSLASAGNWTSQPYMTPDAKYVFFTSEASDLVVGDTNNTGDVFRYEVETGNIIRVSEAANGNQFNDYSEGNAVSADGRYVVFNSRATDIIVGDNNNTWDIFVKDMQTGNTERVNISSDEIESNGNSWMGSISNDGRYITFVSQASNLVSGDTNGVSDVFLHDRVTGETTRVSIANDGSQLANYADNSWISGNGKFVVYDSRSSNIVTSDTNNTNDVFVYDVENGTTERVSLSSSETEGNSNSYLEYMVVRSISDDGRFIVFASDADNLVTGDTNGRKDVFLRDRLTGETFLINKTPDGSQSNNWSEDPSISANGKYIVYTSGATNLVNGDTNSTSDIFIQQINYQIKTKGYDSVDSDGTFNGTDTNTLNEIAAGTSSISMTVGVDNPSGALLTYVFSVDLNGDGIQQSEIIGTVDSSGNSIALAYSPQVLSVGTYNTQVVVKDSFGTIIGQLTNFFKVV
jgi:Tol biopolymer transport system component